MRPRAQAASRITAAALLSGLPLTGRRAGQELARRELSKSIYQPGLWQRFAGWLSRLADGGAGLPGRWWSLVAAVLAAILVGAAARALGWPARPARRRRSRPVLIGPPRAAADHRREAEQRAAAGEYAAAIIELVRAIAAGLEERGVLARHPGRTADELAAAAGAAFPQLRAELGAAARLFDDVRYGGRAGTMAGYLSVRSVYTGLQTARLSPSAGPGHGQGAAAGPAPAAGTGVPAGGGPR